jgi:hypothetical protein
MSGIEKRRAGQHLYQLRAHLSEPGAKDGARIGLSPLATFSRHIGHPWPFWALLVVSLAQRSNASLPTAVSVNARIVFLAFGRRGGILSASAQAILRRSRRLSDFPIIIPTLLAPAEEGLWKDFPSLAPLRFALTASSRAAGT